jgi:haloacetate dehalogenase
MTTPAPPVRLPGFEYRRVDVEGVTINCAVRGSGPPLLLHGYPENHVMWRHVAPGLAEDRTVVVADLRGYGDSGKPTPDAERLVYAKRAMARDQVGLMRQLGEVWQQYATDVRGSALPTGHFLPEEAPDLVAAALRDFLG